MLGNWLNRLCYNVAGNGGRECSESRKKQSDGIREYISLSAVSVLLYRQIG